MQRDDIGVILVGGMRSHQENYAAAFAEEKCRLLAVALADDMSAEDEMRHRALAEHWNVPLLSLPDALRLADARVASIAVPMPHRAATIAACANAGMHLYLDKPLAGTPRDAASIADAVSRAGVTAQIFSHVTAGWAQRARSAIQDGRLGRVVAVHADMLMAKGQPTQVPSKVRAESPQPADFPEDVAKREMTDMGAYPLSLIAWLLGSRCEAVNAATANHFFVEHLERDVEDYGAMLLRFEHNVLATLTCGRSGWQSHHAPYISRVVVVGEGGSMVFGTDQEQLLVTARPAEWPSPSEVDPMGMWLSTRQTPRPPVITRHVAVDSNGIRDVAAFVSALTAGTEQGIDVAAARHHCEILAAAYRSAAERREVALDSIQSPVASR